MSIFNNNLLAGAAAQGGTTPVHTIDQSIRFNDDDSGRMGRTPGSASNRRTWTFSVWIKRGNLDSSGFKFIFSRTEATVAANIAFYQDSLYFSAASGGVEINLVTNRKFRDPSAWYHIIIAQDTTQAVASERVRIYVNGQRETSFSTETYPALNYQGYINTTALHEIGVSRPSGSISGYFDGYMGEIVLIDGESLDSSSFGEYNSSGIWIPKDVSGLTFGTNGFHIDGRDSADLGDDESGNGNDFTTSGLASHDQVPDSPTNNFAVLSPIDKGSMTLSEGNLKGTSGSSSVWQTSKATMGVKSGKWYWEVRAGGTTYNLHGTVGLAQTLNTTASIHPGVPSDGYGWYGTNGAIYHNGSQIATESTYTTGDIISFALDLDDSGGILTAYKNGVSEGNLTTTYKTADTDDFIFPAVGLLVSDTCIINFGQDGTFAGNVTAGGNSDGNGIGNFKYSVPSGFLALCTKNLGS